MKINYMNNNNLNLPNSKKEGSFDFMKVVNDKHKKTENYGKNNYKLNEDMGKYKKDFETDFLVEKSGNFDDFIFNSKEVRNQNDNIDYKNIINNNYRYNKIGGNSDFMYANIHNQNDDESVI